MIDLISWDAKNLDDYNFVFITVWNTCCEAQLENLCEYMEKGGKVMLAKPHLYDTVSREEALTKNASVIKSALVDKLLSYVLRTVYNFFFGVNYGYDGLTLKPRLPKEFDGSKIDFTNLGKKFTVSCKNTGDKKIVFNGKESAGDTFFIADGDMQQTKEVTLYY